MQAAERQRPVSRASVGGVPAPDSALATRRELYPATPRSNYQLRAKLGPCPCQGCGALVYWALSQTRASWNGEIIIGSPRWREATGRVHKCYRPRKNRPGAKA